MPLDPNIPLAARQPDIGRGVMELANIQQQGQDRQMKLQDRQMKIQDREQNNKLTGLQIAGAQNTLDDQQLQRVVTSASTVNKLLKAGNINGATNFLEGRIEAGSQDPERDMSGSIRTLDAIKSGDIDGVIKVTDGLTDYGYQRGWLDRPERIVPNTELGQTQQDVDNGFITPEQSARLTRPQPTTPIGIARQELADGLITGSDFKTIIAKESGLKTQAQVDQLFEIEREKAIIGRDDEVRQLELRRLEQSIAEGDLKLAETKETVEKAEGIKDTAKRLLKDLLENRGGVNSYVGPFERLAFGDFAIGEETTKARDNINQLKSILTADNLGIMSGVLSETDIQIIAGIAGGGLNVASDQDNFIRELERMADTMGVEYDKGGSSSNRQRGGSRGQLLPGVRSVTEITSGGAN